MFNHLVEQDCLTEGVAVDCLHQLLSALCYLHTHYIAHLDIKVCVCVCMCACACVCIRGDYNSRPLANICTKLEMARECLAI